MPPLGKTGVRAPWLPSPLKGELTRVRPALVVMAIVPALLLGGNVEVVGRPEPPENVAWPARPAIVVQQPVPVPGANTQFIGRLSRAEDVRWPARPAVVVGQPVPIPGANVEPTYAPRDLGAVVQVDHTWAFVPIVGQQPIPGANTETTYALRDPNTDPLRPLAVVAEPPDPTLALPSSTFVGRLARDEDTTRPARPMVVQTGAQPGVAAQVRAIGIVHDAPAARVSAHLAAATAATAHGCRFYSVAACAIILLSVASE